MPTEQTSQQPTTFELSISRSALAPVLTQVRRLTPPSAYSPAWLTSDGSRLHVDYCDKNFAFAAQGTWPQRVTIPAKFFFMLAQVPPESDPSKVRICEGRLSVGSSSVPCTCDPHTVLDPVHVQVEKSDFLEIARVFSLNYRSRARTISLELTPGRLHITFAGGGGDLDCPANAHRLAAEITGKSLAGIASAHRHDKTPTGQITLTFQRAKGTFATPVIEVKARFTS